MKSSKLFDFSVFRAPTKRKPVPLATLKEYAQIKPNPKRLPAGITEDGTIQTISLWNANLLVAGMPGTGKSATMTNLLCQMAQIPYNAIICIDPLLVEFAPYAARASFITKGKCCTEIVLRLVYEEGQERIAEMQDKGIRKIEPDDWDSFTPQLTIPFDEAAEGLPDPENPEAPVIKSSSYFYTRSGVQALRKASVSYFLATQRPTNEVLPTGLRNLINQKILHGVERKQDVDTILGAGKSDLAPAHLLTTEQLGAGYVMNAEKRDKPAKFRSSWVLFNSERESISRDTSASDEAKFIADNMPTVEEIVESTAHLRVPLTFLDDNEELQAHLAEHELSDRLALANREAKRQAHFRAHAS